MSAADTLRRLRAEGFTIQPDGRRLIVVPASKMTSDIRDELRHFKDELLALLAAEIAGDPTDTRVTCQRCDHYSSAAHRCRNYRAALLFGPDIAPAIAALPQHCPGFARTPPGDAQAPEGHQAAESAASGPGEATADAHEQTGARQHQAADGFDRARLRQEPAPAVHLGADPAGRPPARPPEGGADA